MTTTPPWKESLTRCYKLHTTLASGTDQALWLHSKDCLARPCAPCDVLVSGLTHFYACVDPRCNDCTPARLLAVMDTTGFNEYRLAVEEFESAAKKFRDSGDPAVGQRRQAAVKKVQGLAEGVFAKWKQLGVPKLQIKRMVQSARALSMEPMTSCVRAGTRFARKQDLELWGHVKECEVGMPCIPACDDAKKGLRHFDGCKNPTCKGCTEGRLLMLGEVDKAAHIATVLAECIAVTGQYNALKMNNPNPENDSTLMALKENATRISAQFDSLANDVFPRCKALGCPPHHMKRPCSASASTGSTATLPPAPPPHLPMSIPVAPPPIPISTTNRFSATTAAPPPQFFTPLERPALLAAIPRVAPPAAAAAQEERVEVLLSFVRANTRFRREGDTALLQHVEYCEVPKPCPFPQCDDAKTKVEHYNKCRTPSCFHCVEPRLYVVLDRNELPEPYIARLRKAKEDLKSELTKMKMAQVEKARLLKDAPNDAQALVAVDEKMKMRMGSTTECKNKLMRFSEDVYVKWALNFPKPFELKRPSPLASPNTIEKYVAPLPSPPLVGAMTRLAVTGGNPLPVVVGGVGGGSGGGGNAHVPGKPSLSERPTRAAAAMAMQQAQQPQLPQQAPQPIQMQPPPPKIKSTFGFEVKHVPIGGEQGGGGQIVEVLLSGDGPSIPIQTAMFNTINEDADVVKLAFGNDKAAGLGSYPTFPKIKCVVPIDFVDWKTQNVLTLRDIEIGIKNKKRECQPIYLEYISRAAQELVCDILDEAREAAVYRDGRNPQITGEDVRRALAKRPKVEKLVAAAAIVAKEKDTLMSQ